MVKRTGEQFLYDIGDEGVYQYMQWNFSINRRSRYLGNAENFMREANRMFVDRYGRYCNSANVQSKAVVDQYGRRHKTMYVHGWYGKEDGTGEFKPEFREIDGKRCLIETEAKYSPGRVGHNSTSHTPYLIGDPNQNNNFKYHVVVTRGGKETALVQKLNHNGFDDLTFAAAGITPPKDHLGRQIDAVNPIVGYNGRSQFYTTTSAEEVLSNDGVNYELKPVTKRTVPYDVVDQIASQAWMNGPFPMTASEKMKIGFVSAYRMITDPIGFIVDATQGADALNHAGLAYSWQNATEAAALFLIIGVGEASLFKLVPSTAMGRAVSKYAGKAAKFPRSVIRRVKSSFNKGWRRSQYNTLRPTKSKTTRSPFDGKEYTSYEYEPTEELSDYPDFSDPQTYEDPLPPPEAAPKVTRDKPPVLKNKKKVTPVEEDGRPVKKASNPYDKNARAKVVEEEPVVEDTLVEERALEDTVDEGVVRPDEKLTKIEEFSDDFETHYGRAPREEEVKLGRTYLKRGITVTAAVMAVIAVIVANEMKDETDDTGVYKADEEDEEDEEDDVGNRRRIIEDPEFKIPPVNQFTGMQSGGPSASQDASGSVTYFSETEINPNNYTFVYY